MIARCIVTLCDIHHENLEGWCILAERYHATILQEHCANVAAATMQRVILAEVMGIEVKEADKLVSKFFFFFLLTV